VPERGAEAAGKVAIKKADRMADNVAPIIHDLRRKGLSTYR
jgi:hypothetical protein